MHAIFMACRLVAQLCRYGDEFLTVLEGVSKLGGNPGKKTGIGQGYVSLTISPRSLLPRV